MTDNYTKYVDWDSVCREKSGGMKCDDGPCKHCLEIATNETLERINRKERD